MIGGGCKQGVDGKWGDCGEVWLFEVGQEISVFLADGINWWDKVVISWGGYRVPGVYQTPVYAPAVQPVPVVDYDTNNTTVFIGNLDPNVTEEELRQLFLQFGEIFNVKIPAAKGCGFVQYGTIFLSLYCLTYLYRTNAEEAIQRMQGAVIGQQVVRLSWGRNPRQDLPGNWQADPSQWGSAYYGYGQGYDAYSYGATHDPSQYPYGAYPDYSQYPQQARLLYSTILRIYICSLSYLETSGVENQKPSPDYMIRGCYLKSNTKIENPKDHSGAFRAEGAQDMGAMTAAAPAVEQREELYDPLATPDVDKCVSPFPPVLNAAYLAVHESAILGRPLWQRTSTLS
ncbi:hypothetical protein RJ639_035821 [Escallonia herrerae]|uniref:RRM domain-containing protein n=1 Tax=Escallonia herrerae TaxID=1293975 RepID=A0AA88WXI5_9ASTE|nr:hypothetical protein RJ639_035821 [Escallonia herrerae]